MFACGKYGKCGKIISSPTIYIINNKAPLTIRRALVELNIYLCRVNRGGYGEELFHSVNLAPEFGTVPLIAFEIDMYMSLGHGSFHNTGAAVCNEFDCLIFNFFIA